MREKKTRGLARKGKTFYEMERKIRADGGGKLKPKPEINPGDLVTVEGYYEYGKVISVEPLGDLYKVDLFFPESKQSHTVIYPLTEIRRISTPLEMVKSFKFDPSYKFNWRDL